MRYTAYRYAALLEPGLFSFFFFFILHLDAATNLTVILQLNEGCEEVKVIQQIHLLHGTAQQGKRQRLRL